jgi:hypothetical protein
LGRECRLTYEKESPKTTRKKEKIEASMPLLRPNAAGIDIGHREHWCAVPADRCAQPVRAFGTFTQDLEEMARWLKECGIKTVAMESTGVYWIPAFQILERHGLEVCLVNARHVKNVSGRKTDIQDCPWLQRLHSFGLLNASFRPPDHICVLRSYLRYRDDLVGLRSMQSQHMQKALQQMNVQLHQVLSDVTGLSGTRIIETILQGERDPVKLAGLVDIRRGGARRIPDFFVAGGKAVSLALAHLAGLGGGSRSDDADFPGAKTEITQDRTGRASGDGPGTSQFAGLCVARTAPPPGSAPVGNRAAAHADDLGMLAARGLGAGGRGEVGAGTVAAGFAPRIGAPAAGRLFDTNAGGGGLRAVFVQSAGLAGCRADARGTGAGV